ncbi:fatty acid synthase-like, partial [Diaphorina citri]|uniref:Fatty acid synthase-like n=1 Tax=Diaphorina citri TaxID=121845 RepID=A0A3Q0J9K4_DIACI
MQANRISFYLNLTGPSYQLDNTWVGGIQCLDIAKGLVEEGSLDGCIVCVANLTISPCVSKQMQGLGVLSTDEFTRSFSSDASGYVRSEAVVAFYIQRLQDAKRSYGSGYYYEGVKKPIWFIFSGMGSQWNGMGTDLLRIPLFRQSMERLDAVLKPHGVDLFHILTSTDNTLFDNILNSFVGIAACQIPNVNASSRWNIYQRNLVHAIIDFDDWLLFLDNIIKVLVYLHVERHSEVYLPRNIESILIDKRLFMNAMKEKHTSLVDVYYDLDTKVKYIFIPSPKPRSSKWISSSILEDAWGSPLAQTSSAEYHTNNLLSSVFFEEASAHIPANAICIEIAPHGLLQAILKRSLAEKEVVNIPLTLRGVKDGVKFILNSIGKLYLNGLDLNLAPLYPEVQYPVSRGTKPLGHFVDWEHGHEYKLSELEVQ